MREQVTTNDCVKMASEGVDLTKIVFLVSGNGGNLKFVYKALSIVKISGVTIFVIADRACGAVEFASRNSIPSAVITYTRKNNDQLANRLLEIDPNIIITNWYKIIDKETISLFQGKFINLHYSLLPAFGGIIGEEPIVRAYNQGCKYIGATCHYVDENVDTGKIIAQTIVKTDIEIRRAIEQVFRKGCFILFNTIIELCLPHLIDSQTGSKQDFAPDLVFDCSIFDEKFWDELSKS